MDENAKMVDMRTWDEFRDAGMLWLVNSILHIFGWAITLQSLDGGGFIAIPARCKFRGFDESSNDKGYRKVTEYMKNNVDQLLEDLDS